VSEEENHETVEALDAIRHDPRRLEAEDAEAAYWDALNDR
jgi:hypothetical protein